MLLDTRIRPITNSADAAASDASSPTYPMPSAANRPSCSLYRSGWATAVSSACATRSRYCSRLRIGRSASRQPACRFHARGAEMSFGRLLASGLLVYGVHSAFAADDLANQAVAILLPLDYAESAIERNTAGAHNSTTHRRHRLRCCGLVTVSAGGDFAGSETRINTRES